MSTSPSATTVTGTIEATQSLRGTIEATQSLRLLSGDDAEANYRSPFPHFATNATHAGQDPAQWGHLQVIPPISTATTYMQMEAGKPKIYDYGRGGNPTRTVLEQCLASLEDAKKCYTFASGLATASAIIELLHPGDEIACCDDVYGGTQRFFKSTGANHGIVTKMVNMTNLENLKAALGPKTRMVWIESPTNPLLSCVDVAEATKIAKAHNKDIYVVCDNTFMTPYFQRPLAMGVDIVMHSITKYLNGHSDVVMGCAMTNRDDIAEKLVYTQFSVGAIPSPFDCYLANRGLKTLAVRMRAHSANGMAVAKFLETNSRVEKVLYPALPSHPHHAIHKKQTKGMSGMCSFYIKGGLKEADTFLKSLKIFTLAESLGGFESLAELPSVMTHASVPAAERATLGITDNLLRMSVGIEDVDDLLADLEQALRVAVP